ncbi:tyrosine-type recombinase/integrase [Streptomyces sp. NBC_00390]|uniref:tyrosine-type recombinase/integrase n=1 Tax=Streptomyces sp. NBC_00390 TaxID=2975736 RepID=UPI002E1D9522
MREDANTALAEAGADVSVPEKVTLHSLRDFYATTLITKRENVKTVQVRLGHSKPSITLDKYVGFWPTDEDTTAAAIESVPGGPEQGADLKPSALVVPSQSALGSRAPS